MVTKCMEGRGRVREIIIYEFKVNDVKSGRNVLLVNDYVYKDFSLRK